MFFKNKGVMGIKPFQLSMREGVTKDLLRINKLNKEIVLRAFNCPYTRDNWVALRTPKIEHTLLSLR